MGVLLPPNFLLLKEVEYADLKDETIVIKLPYSLICECVCVCVCVCVFLQDLEETSILQPPQHHHTYKK